ncbi:MULTISPECIES: LPP leucine zipper domain-containing protein [unclassified Microcoleus]|uniref:LPP leucine zipper domain-containing protein n=1 Tax=unclassified Microcoleus TaxID=2642155 RepID=UPI002FD1E722
MTTASNNEPTLVDVIEKLDKLSTNVGKLSTDVDKLSTDVEHLSTEFDKLSKDSEKFNDRFSNYQQATQWVVQLAFTLIASATITVIITSVLRK